MNKILKVIGGISLSIYKIIDKIIVTPISKLIYIIQSKLKNNSGRVEKFLNKPHMLVYLSLAFAVAIFFLVDSRVISLVQTEAEILVDQPVTVQYNKEAYVIEGLPDSVDITLIGRKSDLYLAKQLGDHEAILDLTDYEEGTYKVRLTLNQTIDSLNYKLDPGTVTVVIKQRISSLKSVAADLLNEDQLDSKLSVKSIALSNSEVVVKGSKDTLATIATVKALIDLNNEVFTDKGTYKLDNIPLIAYDSNGKIVENVEIVGNNMTATLELDSYSIQVPVKVITTGTLKTGRAISKILVNNKEDYKVTIYGDKSVLDNVTEIPVTVDVTDQGNQTKTFNNLSLTKPTGVRHISDTTVAVSLQFAEESQRTVEGVRINTEGLDTNKYSPTAKPGDDTINVQVKGVDSVIKDIKSEHIYAYVDLSSYGVGVHEVKVEIRSADSKVVYVPTRTVTIEIKAR